MSYPSGKSGLRTHTHTEVYVAEEDLPSFLEVAEDLNVKGLCENNKPNFDLNEEDPLQYSYLNNHPSTKNKNY